jgi:peptidoglycan hydrolase-like protein with peptidoglycan-binding domain
MNLNENINRIKQVMGLYESNDIDIKKEIERRRKIIQDLTIKRSEITTWMIEDGDAVVRKGDHNSAVQEIQELLTKLNYDIGPKGVDRFFGPKTESAVKKFQQDNNLVVDGISGKKTLEMLEKVAKPITDAEIAKRQEFLRKVMGPEDETSKIMRQRKEQQTD